MNSLSIRSIHTNMILLLYVLPMLPYLVISENVCTSIESKKQNLLVFGELESSLFLMTTGLFVATPPKAALSFEGDNNNITKIDLRTTEFSPIEEAYPIFADLLAFRKCKNHIVSARIKPRSAKEPELLILEPNSMFSYRIVYDFRHNELKVRTRWHNHIKPNQTILSQFSGNVITKLERGTHKLVWKDLDALENNRTERVMKETPCPGGGSCDYRTGLIYKEKAVIFSEENVSIYDSPDKTFPTVRSLDQFLKCNLTDNTFTPKHRISFLIGMILFLSVIIFYWVFFCLLFVATGKYQAHTCQ